MRNWAITAGALFCGAVIVAAAVITEISRYNAAVRVAERDTRNAVMLAASHASQVFADVLSSLQGVESIRQDVLKGHIKGREAVARLLDSVRGNDAVIHSVGWTDEKGLQIGRSTDGPLSKKPVDMSRREHFRFHRDAPTAAAPKVLYISRPIQARTTGEWILIASIRLEDERGRFAGVAGAALNPLYFVSVYQRIELGPSRVATLYRSDGIVLSRVPDMAAWIGSAETGGRSLIRDRVSKAPSGTFREAGIGGSVARIVSYKAVPDLPLVVAVSLSLDDALVPFYRGLRITIPAVALVLLFLAGAAWLAELRARERLRSRAALEASEERYRALTELSPAGVFRTDADGNCIYVNGRWCDYAGLPAEAALGKGWTEPLHPEDRDRVVAEWRRSAERAGVFSTEFRFLTSENRVTWLFGRAAAVADADGRPIGYIGTVTDTTAYKHVEEALRRSQKMEVVGQLTGGIAHDVNNLLSILLVNAELLAPMVSGDPKARQNVEGMIRAVHRGADLTRKLLRFSRTTPDEPKRVSANDLIRGVEGLIAKSLTPAIRIGTVLAEDVWMVAIDPGDLEDAILNLALNARDAMPEGGDLIIETVNKVLDDAYATRNPGSAAGEFVMISVSDTGVGMSPEVRDKAFEPFFSTKEEGKGTGLGLSMVYGFVRRSGGHAKIYSETGRGTAVHLYLPRARGTAEPIAAQDIPLADLPRGSETVLMVDDEAALVDLAVTLLGDLGYQMLRATTAKDALEVLGAGRAVDLLFSDVIMPGGMDGYDLALQAVKEWPNLKLLLTSGFSRRREDFVSGKRRIDPGLVTAFLYKPYTMTDLAVAVRHALDGD